MGDVVFCMKCTPSNHGGVDIGNVTRLRFTSRTADESIELSGVRKHNRYFLAAEANDEIGVRILV